MMFEQPPAPMHTFARRTSMPSLCASNDLNALHLPRHNTGTSNRSGSPQHRQRRLSKKSKSDANLSRLTSQERKVDNLPRKAKSRLYKSELCKTFMETGHCKYGGKCQYAHGEKELRFVKKSKNYKTQMCKAFWTTGYCKYGTRCCFLHNDLGGAFQETRSPHLVCQPLPRAESQPTMLFTPTITEETVEDERVEDDLTPLWSDSLTPSLDLNSIADCIVEDDDQPQDVMDAFSVELVRVKARHQHGMEYACKDVVEELQQRLGRSLVEDELNKVKDSFEGPEVTETPAPAMMADLTSLTRKHQSMPNVLFSRKSSSRLNVFQQLQDLGPGQAA